jgi:hypothetical protein
MLIKRRTYENATPTFVHTHDGRFQLLECTDNSNQNSTRVALLKLAIGAKSGQAVFS